MRMRIMASENDLKEYAAALDPLYKDILAAFPRIAPYRKKGFGLALQSIAADFEGNKKSAGISIIMTACHELEKNGLVEIKNEIFVHPTSVGEKLIELISGKQAPEVTVPKLPPVPK